MTEDSPEFTELTKRIRDELMKLPELGQLPEQDRFKLASFCAPIGEAIHDMEKEGMPSGYLFATLVEFMSLDAYLMCIGMLRKAGWIEGSVTSKLTWIGDF